MLNSKNPHKVEHRRKKSQIDAEFGLVVCHLNVFRIINDFILFGFDKSDMYEQSCIFCKIVRKEISANFITENDQALAFLDAYPLALGHTLIIPKTHYSKINEMDKACSVGLFDLLLKVTEPLEKSLKVNSSTIAIHNGREAGQEIPHVHIHVVPRSYGDGGGPIHSLFKKNRPHLDSNTMREIVDRIKENMK